MGIRSFLTKKRFSRRSITQPVVHPAVGLAVQTCVERLEGRQLLAADLGNLLTPPVVGVGPTADVNANDDKLVAGGTAVDVWVRYEDADGVNSASIGVDDVVLVTPGGAELTPIAFTIDLDGDDSTTGVVGDGTRLAGVYTFAAPGGSWDSADNGKYIAKAIAGSVTDAAGNPSLGDTDDLEVNLAGSGPISPPPPVVVPPPPIDVTAPTAVMSLPATITDAGGTTASVTVVYSDDVAINAETINPWDIEAKLGKQKLTVQSVNVTPSADRKTVTAVYTIAAPGGSWGYEDNGSVRVELAPLAVADTSRNRTAAQESSFAVNIAPPPAPLVAPVASVTPVAKVVTAGNRPNTITVTYTDADGVIDASSIGLDDITVTGPGGSPLAIEGFSIVPQTDAARITATYRITAPGGSWDSADNGAYTVTVLPGAVVDGNGMGTATVATAFNVEVPVPVPVVDSGFSGGAPVNTGFVAEASAALAGNKLLVVGRQGDPAAGTSQYVLKRFNADGSADLSFGKGGVAVSAIGQNDAAFAVVVADDGSILIAGGKNGDLTVTRFKANGSLEGKFGKGGQVVVDLGAANDRGLGIALSADGSVVVVGVTGTQGVVVKLTARGELDAGFGVGGVITTDNTTGSALSGVAILGDGRVVAGGSVGGQVVVYRFLPNGFADATFGGSGRVVVAGLSARTDLGDADTTVSVALQGDKVLVSGRSGGDFAVARLNADGSLDGSFSGGIATIDLGGDDDADQIIVQGSGQILVVGTSEQGATVRLGVAVLNDDGSLDTSFGDAGKASVDSGIQGNGRALHVGQLVVRAFAAAQQNGQLVVGAGQSGNGGSTAPASSALRRLNVPGSGSLGTFGLVNGRRRKLSFVDNDGTRVTVDLKGGGSARALYDGTRVDIIVTGSNDSSVLTVSTRGGDRYFQLRNLTANAGLKAIRAKGAMLEGAISIAGNLGTVELRSIKGTLAASGNIGSVRVGADIDGGYVLAGTSLGSDLKFGSASGASSETDTYGGGAIGSVRVGGAIRRSVIAAGLSPQNSTPLVNDSVVNPATSVIGLLSARNGLDAASRVIAGGVGSAKIPGKVDPLTDSRFDIITG
jgi:uncharacterized delta-60 repeat protein